MLDFVNLKAPTGKNHHPGHEARTIESVKQKIQDKELEGSAHFSQCSGPGPQGMMGIPDYPPLHDKQRDQRLIFAGKQLEDGCACNIQQKSKLRLVLCPSLRGGR
jgi:hypothetical protein